MLRAERWILGAVLAALVLVPVARNASGGVTVLVATGSSWKYLDNGSDQ
ncbi:MAG TPA: hypothetical protein VGS98_13145 [Thermoanaerobaculia bacterium]|jgi:hypothetical protein|nr:hypothetical protein [Thermoanaerobaculia bacterium]